jgi:hypothetical protein
MTKISQMNGLTPAPFVPTFGIVQDFVPYTGLTEGEMRLWLLRNQALTYRQLYPEYKEYQKAYDMLTNALHSNISAGVKFIGAIPDELQVVARAIDQASRQTAPTSRGGLISRIGPSAIGDIVQTNIPDSSCEAYATRITNMELKAKFKFELSTTNWKRLKGGKWVPGTLLLNLSKNFSSVKWYQKWENNRLKCESQKTIEGILNGFVINGSHHVLYKEMPNESYVPTLVRAKTVNHQGGVAGLATAGGMKDGLMNLWTETAIQAKNASINIGALNSLQSSSLLAPDPEQFNALLISKLEEAAKKRLGIGSVAATVAIIGAITAAITAAATLVGTLKKEENYALSAAQGTGFGTEKYSASKKDWVESKDPNAKDPNTDTTSGNDSMLPLILGGVGLYLLSQD